VQPLLLVPPALVVALALDQGGFDPSAWVWAGAVAAWAAATALIARRELRLSRHGWAWVASALTVLAWVALSWLWSDRRVQTVLEARRAAVYVGAVLALVVLVSRATVHRLLLATHVAVTVVVVYALARYLAESRGHDTFEGTLLAQPLGYANALAVLAAIGVVLGAGLGAVAGAPRLRGATLATIPVDAAALALTHSRGAAVALGAGLVVTLLSSNDAAPFVRAALVALPGSVVAAVAASVSRLSDGNAAPRPHAAWAVGGVVALCAAGTALAAARAGPAWRLRHVPRAAIAVVLAAAAGGAFAANASTEPRSSFWRVAWHQFEGHVAGGSGAGTFALAWIRSGLVASRGGALDAHSLYLETLAELGIVGLLLLLVFLVLPLAHSNLRGGNAPVAAGAYVVFLVHAGLDWDWEMPAVVLAGLCCGAALLVPGEEQPRAVGLRSRTVLCLLALGLGAASIAGARSSSEPGVLPRLPVAVPDARASGLAVPLRLPVLLRGRLRGAGRERVAVTQVRLHGSRGDDDPHPRMLSRVGAMAEQHAVLLARRSVLAARRAVLAAGGAVLMRSARCALRERGGAVHRERHEQRGRHDGAEHEAKALSDGGGVHRANRARRDGRSQEPAE
jgi:hypothetical protein